MPYIAGVSTIRIYGKIIIVSGIVLRFSKIEREKNVFKGSLELSKIFVKIGLTFSVVDFKNSIN